jgi:TonB family protein
MTLFLDGTLKVSLVIIVGLAAAAALRGRSAALRHWVLATTIAAAMAVPLLESVVPAWNIQPGPVAAPARQQPVGTARSAEPSEGASLEFTETVTATIDRRAAAMWGTARLLTSAWILGAAGSLLILLIGLSRLFWIASRAEPVRADNWTRLAEEIGRTCNLRKPVTLLLSDHPSLLVTWGLIRPKVIIPRTALDWDDDRIRIVLRHELAHIRRGDWAVQIAGEVLRAAYWFNPILWVACARLRLESERACDDEVLSGGVDGPEYATHLLEVARALNAGHAPRLPAPAVARSSSLERRIRAMLDVQLTRTPTTRAVRFLTGAALLTVAVTVAAAQTGPVKLSGTVYDSTGAPVPGATVVLSHSQSQAKYEVKSNATGYFEFVPLPADSYVLAGALPGFKKIEEPVTLSGKSLNRDLRLSLGELQETISVVGSREAPEESSPRGGVSGGVPGGVPGGVAGGVPARAGFQRDLEACKPSSTGGRVRPPRKIKDVRPIYPAHLRTTGATGEVGLQATITTDGTVREAIVVKSAHPDLDAAALEAVRQWLFDGTLLNCVPTEVVMNVKVDFGMR